MNLKSEIFIIITRILIVTQDMNLTSKIFIWWHIIRIRKSWLYQLSRFYYDYEIIKYNFNITGIGSWKNYEFKQLWIYQIWI